MENYTTLAAAILALPTGEQRTTTERHGSGAVTTHTVTRGANEIVIREEYTAASARIAALQAEDGRQELKCRPEELAAALGDVRAHWCLPWLPASTAARAMGLTK